ncbi:xanthine/uracil permase YicO [Escherichia coli]|uniref:Xanthine/uracil permase YicO n=1 Tax=Escherichia coli TaxID=562 RepID=A0A376MLH3_ECOLX|nr:xanthine/uracil permase YicO [Escherichia coli]
MLIASVRWQAHLLVPHLLLPILKVLLVWRSVVRTGLTAVVVGVMFLLVMFFSPLVAMVPPYATAGALIFVGVLMTSSLARVNWDDFTESVPAFITTVMMPFTFSITEGIALGFMSYCIMKVCTGAAGAI